MRRFGTSTATNGTRSIVRRGRRIAIVVTLGLLVVYLVALAVTGDRFVAAIDLWLNSAVHVGMLVVAWMSVAVATQPVRTPLVFVCLALTSYVVGDVLFVLVPPGAFTAADAGYLLFYPLALTAIVLVLVRFLRRQTWSIVINTLVSSLGIGAAVAAVLGPLLDAAPVEGAVVSTLYPLLDGFALALIVGVSVSQGVRRFVRWLPYLIGLALLLVGDTVYRLQLPDYEVGAPLGAVWAIALVALSLGTVALSGGSDSASSRVPSLLVAVLAIATALVILGVDMASPLPPLATGLAIVTLALGTLPLVFRDRLLRAASMTDELTGLANRLGLVGAEERSFSARSALAVVDLERFGRVNDLLGRAAGDAVLIEAADRIRAAIGRHGVVARVSGDEFAIYLPGGDEHRMHVALDRVDAALADRLIVADTAVRLAARAGIALGPEHGDDATELLHRASVALHRGKAIAEPRHRFDAADLARAERRARLLEDVRLGLERDEFVPFYQPQIDPVSGTTAAVEALVRWRHPKHGLLIPAEFLDIAAEGGLLPDLSLWMLAAALDDTVRWRASGLDLRVAVNLPPSALVDDDLDRTISSMLAERRLPASVLTLEVTEESVIRDDERTLAMLTRISESGVCISVDDFGTGYSSLSRLRQLPIGELKIDRSFTSRISEELPGESMVQWIVDLARSLHLRVVVEGVQSDTALAEVVAMGCDLVQGFAIARPMPVDELTAWLERRVSQLRGTRDD